MAVRKILTDKNPILRKKCREVETIDEHILTLLDDMKETLKKAVGAGLAAPQVGILRRVVVIDTGEGGELLELINPKIVKSSGEQESCEGCLSIPGIRGTLIRPAKVTVQAFDREGNLMEYKGEDFIATVFAHEIDHLDGTLFIDKVTEFEYD